MGGEKGDSNREGQVRVGGTVTGTGKVRGRSERVQQQEEDGEKATLVKNVQEYWVFYKGEDANTVWDL